MSDEPDSAVEQSSEAPVPGPALEPPAQASAAPDPTVEPEPAQIEIGENDPPVFGRMEVPLEDGSGRTVPKIVIRPDAIKNWGRKDQPRKFTPEIAMRIIQYLGGGCYLETAAMAAGILTWWAVMFTIFSRALPFRSTWISATSGSIR